MAALATLGNLVLALLAGYLIVRKKIVGRLWLSALILLPWALPGTVLGLSLANTFSQYRPLQGRVVLVGTTSIPSPAANPVIGCEEFTSST